MPHHRSQGFTLPLMLIILIALAYSGMRLELNGSYLLRRDREEELLFRGRAYMNAIKSYYLAAPGVAARYPAKLEELVADPRFRGRRHIRQLYDDPMTGGGFGLLRNESGGIVGVVSASAGAPFLKTGFDEDLDGFDKAATYREWRFDVSKRLQVLMAKPGSQLAVPLPPTPKLPIPGK